MFGHLTVLFVADILTAFLHFAAFEFLINVLKVRNMFC